MRPLSPATAVVFLDRDGVINRVRPDHVKSWAEFEFMPRALEALAELHRRGLRLVVVTNQASVGRGLLSDHELTSIHERMLSAVQAAGGSIEAVYACTHTPEVGCSCRKPGTDLFKRASTELQIQLRESYVIGDSWSDVQAALSVAATPILIGQRPRHETTDAPLPVAEDLYDATIMLLGAVLKPELAGR